MIYIVGYSRSGTKMINRILESMNVVSAVPEIHFFEEIYNFEKLNILENEERKKLKERLIQNVRRREPDRIRNGLMLEEIESDLEKFIIKENDLTALDIYKHFARLLNFGNTPIDSTPRNAYHIRKIKKLIPDAKFIYMIRDPRDCILSQSVKWKKYYIKGSYFESLRLFMNYHPFLMAKFWKNSLQEYESATAEVETKGDIILLRYEDVTLNPFFAVQKLSKFLDHDIKNVELNYINQNNSYKWKNQYSKATLYLIERTLSNELTDYNYQKSIFSLFDKFMATLVFILYSLKIPFLILLNLNRSRNFRTTLNRRFFGHDSIVS